MRIKIWDDKYIIKSDKYEYRLIAIKEKEEEAPDDGDENEEGVVVGHYATIGYLLEDLVNMEQRMNRCTTIDGYVKHIEKVNKQLEDILKQIQAVIGTKESLTRILSTWENRLPEEIKAIGEVSAEEKPKRGRKKKTE